MTKNSETLFSQASDILPGGVNSPVRAFQRVGGAPVFLSGAKALISMTPKESNTLTTLAPGDR